MASWTAGSITATRRFRRRPAPGDGLVPRGTLVRAEQATRGDGKVNRRESYENGQLASVEEDTNGDGTTDKWETWSGGALRVMALDTKGTGKPDRRLVYPPTDPLRSWKWIATAAEPSWRRRAHEVAGPPHPERRGTCAVTVSNQISAFRPVRSSVFGSTVLWISGVRATSPPWTSLLAGLGLPRGVRAACSRRSPSCATGRRCCACSTARARPATRSASPAASAPSARRR